MNLYLITRNKTKGYDVVNGFVIRAVSEESARLQASTKFADEGVVTWLDSGRSTCTRLATGVQGETEIILRDFNAG